MIATLTTKEITFSVLSKENQLLMLDPSEGTNMACVLLYRGDICVREISKTLSILKMSGKMTFVDWCPTGFKTGINYQPMTLIPPSGMAFSSKSLTMVVNSTGIKSIFTNLNRKFLMLFNKRAFVHWFIGEGMEEGEFNEAYDDLMVLEQDFSILEDLSETENSDKEYTDKSISSKKEINPTIHQQKIDDTIMQNSKYLEPPQKEITKSTKLISSMSDQTNDLVTYESYLTEKEMKPGKNDENYSFINKNSHYTNLSNNSYFYNQK